MHSIVGTTIDVVFTENEIAFSKDTTTNVLYDIEYKRHFNISRRHWMAFGGHVNTTITRILNNCKLQFVDCRNGIRIIY
jgi:hypothetical protein